MVTNFRSLALRGKPLAQAPAHLLTLGGIAMAIGAFVPWLGFRGPLSMSGPAYSSSGPHGVWRRRFLKRAGRACGNQAQRDALCGAGHAHDLQHDGPDAGD